MFSSGLASHFSVLVVWFSPVKAWADAFRSSPDLTGVVSVYEDLRRKGLEFPMTELNGYSTGQPQQKVQAWLLLSLLTLGCYLSPLVSLLFRIISVPFADQTPPANGPAVVTLPAALLSSKPPLIPPQTSELKLALEGTNALTPSQVMLWLFFSPILAELHVLVSTDSFFPPVLTNLPLQE